MPSLIPPPSHVIDTHKHYSIAAAIIATGIIASLSVIGRLSQKYTSRTMGLDDYAVIPALILYVNWTAFAAYLNLNSGIGKPIGEVTYGEIITFYKGTLITLWLYPAVSASIRISILFFYQRLFTIGVNKAYRIILWILLVLQFVYLVAFEITPIFICKPIRDGWEPRKRPKNCKNYVYIDNIWALYSVSLAFDVILLVFPIFIVSKLRMGIRKRLQVAFIFLLMACAPAVAAYKLQVVVNKARIDLKKVDPNWFHYEASKFVFPQFRIYGTAFWIPTHMEPTVALIGTSIPSMLKLYSSASLQFFQIRSAFVTSLKGSPAGSHGSQKSQSQKRPGWWSARYQSEAETRDQGNVVGESLVELRPVESASSTRLDHNPLKSADRSGGAGV